MHFFRKDAPKTMPGQVRDISRMWDDLLPLAFRHDFHKKASYLTISEADSYSIGYVKKGAISVISALPDGQESIKMVLNQGVLFHESYVVAGFYQQFPLHKCLEDTDIYMFSGHLLMDATFRKKYPEHFYNALWAMAVKQSANDMRSDILALKSVGMKVAKWLLIGVENYGCSFEPGMTQQELGSLLNIFKTSMNRTIQALLRSEIIEDFSKKQCAVLDSDRLKAVAEGEIEI